MARVTIKLYGYLKRSYDIILDATDVAEVINGLSKQTDVFKKKLQETLPEIRVHGYDTIDSLYTPFDKDEVELHIMPDIRGGKSGGFFKIAIGIAFIALAFTGVGTATLPALLGGGTLKSTLFSMGLSLVLGGVMELMSPAPQLDTLPSQQDPEASKYLSGSQNTVKIGTRIPLVYGTHKTGGHYLSFNVDAKDVSV